AAGAFAAGALLIAGLSISSSLGKSSTKQAGSLRTVYHHPSAYVASRLLSALSFLALSFPPPFPFRLIPAPGRGVPAAAALAAHQAGVAAAGGDAAAGDEAEPVEDPEPQAQRSPNARSRKRKKRKAGR